MWGIRPKKGTHPAGNLDSLIYMKSLQSLDVKDAIVEFAVSAVVPMNTLPLPKHLSTHRDSPFPHAASREILNRLRNVGNKFNVSSNGASEKTSLEKTQSL